MRRSSSLLSRIQEAVGLAPRRGVQPNPGVWVLIQTDWSGRLTSDEMQQMAGICPPRSIRRNEVIYRKGDQADSLFILLEGYVKISLTTPKGERVLGVLGPDDMFGESFLTLTRQRQSDAACLSSTALICPISRPQFLEVAQKIPTVMQAFATVLAERICSLEQELRLTTQPAEVRLAGVLLTLAERFGGKDSSGWVELNLELKQEELGSLASTTRVNTTQTLSTWRELGLLEGTRGRYRIHVLKLRERIEELMERG